MGYSIIFDTQIVKLSDGRLLHLDRSGCNNDTAGRSLSDYTGKIYTYEEFQKYVTSFTQNSKSDDWELKLGSKKATYYDYGKQLARKTNNAKNFEDFNNERYFYAERFDGVDLLEPEQKTLTPEEFSNCFYDLLYSGKPFSYSRITTRLNTEKDIITALDNNETINFYVGKKYKARITA